MALPSSSDMTESEQGLKAGVQEQQQTGVSSGAPAMFLGDGCNTLLSHPWAVQWSASNEEERVMLLGNPMGG